MRCISPTAVEPSFQKIAYRTNNSGIAADKVALERQREKKQNNVMARSIWILSMPQYMLLG